MKKIIIVLSIVCLLIGLSACKSKNKEQANPNADLQVATVHNSQNSLDWAGTYSGVIPCADCPGIEVQIILNSDNTFQMTRRYQGKENSVYSFSGTFQWNSDGNIIILNGLEKNRFPTQYLVGENMIRQLDMEGNVINGDLAQNYVLNKVE